MSLKERITADNRRVFMNTGHFADDKDSPSGHTWNGRPFTCIVDEDEALKRKNNNVVDLSWDNNTREKTIYVPVGDLPGHAAPNDHIFFDNTPMKVLQVSSSMGMLEITLVAYDPKAVAEL